MGKNSAEYMRAYRARRKAERQQVNGWADRANACIAELEAEVTQLKVELGEAKRTATEYATLSNDRADRIAELEEEVRHLKAELANDVATSERWWRALEVKPSRKAQQAQRDAILRKINRGG